MYEFASYGCSNCLCSFVIVCLACSWRRQINDMPRRSIAVETTSRALPRSKSTTTNGRGRPTALHARVRRPNAGQLRWLLWEGWQSKIIDARQRQLELWLRALEVN